MKHFVQKHRACGPSWTGERMKRTIRLQPSDIEIAIDHFLRDSGYTRTSDLQFEPQKDGDREYMEIEVKVESIGKER